MESPSFENPPGTNPEVRSSFPTTNWGAVLHAGHTNSAQAAVALEKLCRAYWYPLYAYVRRQGHDAADAEDLTQTFFAHLFTEDALKGLDREKGRFRSFLVTALKNFLSGEHRRQAALKRAGAHRLISWDKATAEGLYRDEPDTTASPLLFFERRWALTLIDAALARLAQEAAESGRQQLFDRLQPCLTQETEPGFAERIAVEFNMTEGSVTVALHRLRRRFGELLRREVAYTVAGPEDIEEEIRHLFAVLAQ